MYFIIIMLQVVYFLYIYSYNYNPIKLKTENMKFRNFIIVRIPSIII